MKVLSKRLIWLVIVVLALVLAVACGPATPPADAVPETSEAEGEVETPVPESESSADEAEEASDPAEAEAPEAEAVELEGAMTTESGLQFLEKVAGDGPTPQEGDLVTMHFSGTLTDGTLFGDTYSSGTPITIVYGRGQLLPGWEEGVGMMRAGGEAQMLLPAELAFGEAGFGSIPPNAPVIIDVELLSIEAPPEPVAVDEGDLETTDSGLQYYDIEEGDGDVPEEGGTVATDYTIWVKEEDGNKFIVTSKDSGPINFTVGSIDTVFPGWDEGVRTMKVGGKRLLIVPPEIALGAQGGGEIPPDATLVLEIDLVEANAPVKMTEVDPDDYTETDSGLQYFDIVEGDGDMPEQGQTVIVHYTGWLEDGTKFDSSIDRGQPYTFPLGLGNVIAGWDEGVATMKVGGMRQLRIPADLAYGDAGSGTIPPGATLIFDVELLDIVP
ncbi:MAG: FKBP-type peptidyl-prolyl cis-trans isomerase [Candidatus Promineifilaceae bacterium]|nr:FKBP-type peptidyl-prolyl cis-trans isomerase [Candidatus Promineifilaceae bacterium]